MCVERVRVCEEGVFECGEYVCKFVRGVSECGEYVLKRVRGVFVCVRGVRRASLESLLLCRRLLTLSWFLSSFSR